jgi:oligoendopeptidase F
MPKKETYHDKMSWDLSVMYSGVDDPKITGDLKALQKTAAEIEKKHKNKLIKYTPVQLRNFFVENNKYNEKVYRLGCYVALLTYQDAGNRAAAALMQKLEVAFADMNSHFIFIDLELAKHPKLKEYSALKEMRPYNIFLENILKFRKHLLNYDQEDILNKLSLTSRDGWDKLYEQNFSKVTVDFKGKVLNKEQLFNLLHSEERTTRKDAAKAYSELLKKNMDLNVQIYNMLLVDKFQRDKLRKYSYPEESRHLGNGVSQRAVETMVEETKKNFRDVARFYKIKQKLLKIKDFTYYDRLAPVSFKGSKQKKYTFAEGVEITRSSFSKFDPEFAKIFMDLVNSNRIDAEIRNGKKGGGFCMFMPKDIKPYILINYFGMPRDVQTLAHEAGHAIHDVFASKTNPLTVAHAPLTLAEVGSIFAEMVVFENLIKEVKTKEEKIVLLAERIEDIIATIFRQVVFYIFEQKVHRYVQENGAITEAQLYDFWRDTQKLMFGDSVRFDEGYDSWWSYVSHFFNSPFYVYAYAMANLLVFAIYQEYKEGQENFVQKYKDFLALGGTKSTEDAVKSFGFNLEDPKFWRQGFEIITGMIDELEELC